MVSSLLRIVKEAAAQSYKTGLATGALPPAAASWPRHAYSSADAVDAGGERYCLGTASWLLAQRFPLLLTIPKTSKLLQKLIGKVATYETTLF